MLSRAAVGRQASRAARTTWQQTNRRGMADVASGSFSYQTGEANGVKYASRDIPGAVGTLALVTQAGTRFEPLPGLAEGLQRYAFKVTWPFWRKPENILLRQLAEHGKTIHTSDTARI